MNIIITGTSRGIGLPLALQCAEAGHHVLALSRKIPQELLQHPNITCFSLDLTVENGL
jgi:NAD(P)-dependent dehydrogenase (short-subunit alcohol dehydrogenase family)